MLLVNIGIRLHLVHVGVGVGGVAVAGGLMMLGVGRFLRLPIQRMRVASERLRSLLWGGRLEPCVTSVHRRRVRSMGAGTAVQG